MAGFQISKWKYSFRISKIKKTFFSFPWGGMAHLFSKFKNKSFHFKFQKHFFKKIHGGINDFFLDPRLPNLFKIYKSYLFNLKKQSYTAYHRVYVGCPSHICIAIKSIGNKQKWFTVKEPHHV
jgi:hypothetical protein